MIHIPAPKSADEEKLLAGVKPPVPPSGPPKKKRRGLLLGIGLVGLLGAGAAAFYLFYPEPPPPPPPPRKLKVATVVPSAAPVDVAIAPKPTHSPEPLTPSDTLNALAKVPVNAIAKAQAAVDGQRANQAERADPLGTDETPLARHPGPPSITISTPPPTVMTDTTLAPGITISIPDDNAASEASPAFRTFVAEAKVSGVRSGPPASALINGRYVRAGQSVDNGLGLGIVFEGAEASTRQLMFKDRTGATVTRRY